MLLQAVLADVKSAPWADIISPLILLSTYRLFVDNLVQLFAGTFAGTAFDDAMATALSKAGRMHSLHDSTNHLPTDCSILLQLQKVWIMRHEKEEEGSDKQMVEAVCGAHAALKGDFGRRLKADTSEASFKVLDEFMQALVASDRMDKAKKVAIASCQVVFDNAERTRPFVLTLLE